MSREKPHFVYCLVDPFDGKIRYVGKSKSPRSRLSAHMKESKVRQNTAKKTWIHGLLKKGTFPKLEVVAETYDPVEARTMESATCHKHQATIYSIHDPAKGAKDFKTQAKKQHAKKD